MGTRRPGQPDQPGPDPGDDTGAGQHGGRPVPGRGEGEHHGQRMPEGRIGELEARIHGPQSRRPGLVSRRLGAARPVDDVHADHLVEADAPAPCRRVGGRDPHVGLELPEAHDVERGGQCLGLGGQPAQARVGPALADQRELGVERRFHPDDVHVRGGRHRPQRRRGFYRQGIRQTRRHDHAQARPSQARRLPGPAHLVIHERQHVPGRVQQYGARRREPEAFAPALQQRGADDFFQPPDLLAQGGLGDEHPLRGVREAARVSEGYEVTQVP